MGSVVDSGVLIQIEREGKNPGDLLEGSSEVLVVATITVAELSFGLYRADSPERQRGRQHFIQSMLALFPVFDFDLRAAEAYAHIWAYAVTTGQIIAAHDLMIAATALANNFSVLTDNVRHFSRVPGLDVRQPNW